MEAQTMSAVEIEDEPDPGWWWGNLRSLGISIELWVWPWHVSAGRDDDVYGGYRWVSFGPLGLKISYSIGNISAERFPFGLSLEEAWDRAVAARRRSRHAS